MIIVVGVCVVSLRSRVECSSSVVFAAYITLVVAL